MKQFFNFQVVLILQILIVPIIIVTCAPSQANSNSTIKQFKFFRDPRVFAFIRDFFQPSTVELSSSNFHHKQGRPPYPVANAPFPAGNGGNLVDVEDISLVTKLLRLGSESMEGLLNKVNHFDKLKCIPRLMCQTIAKREEDRLAAEELERLRPTIRTSTTVKPRKAKLKPKRKNANREKRTVKFQGVETALEQFVNFLDLMQLKDWVLYPYLQGAYEGSTSKKSDECTTKFSTCPFSDTQLVHYFNNYNGGVFNSFQKD